METENSPQVDAPLLVDAPMGASSEADEGEYEKSFIDDEGVETESTDDVPGESRQVLKVRELRKHNGEL